VEAYDTAPASTGPEQQPDVPLTQASIGLSAPWLAKLAAYSMRTERSRYHNDKAECG